MSFTGNCPVIHMPTPAWAAAWGQAGARPPHKPVRAIRSNPSETQWLNSIYSIIEVLAGKEVATQNETFQKYISMQGTFRMFRMNFTGNCPVIHMPIPVWAVAWGQSGVRPLPKPVRALRANPSETQWHLLKHRGPTRKKVANLHETFQKCISMHGSHNTKNEFHKVCPVIQMPTPAWQEARG